jgi:hypothetical protein
MSAADSITADLVRDLFHYDPETGLLVNKKQRGSRGAVGAAAGSVGANGYLRTRVNGADVYIHRLIWLFVTGAWPAADIDHKNGCKTDNRLSNLRSVTRAENQQNQANAKAHNKSGLLGAHISPDGSIYSEITVAGERVRLGRFNSPEEAHAAYLKAKAKQHPFATRVWMQVQKPAAGSTA